MSPLHSEILSTSVVHTPIGSFDSASMSMRYAFDVNALPRDFSGVTWELLNSTVNVHEPSHLFDVYNTLAGAQRFMEGVWGLLQIVRLVHLLPSLSKAGYRLRLPLWSQRNIDENLARLEMQRLWMADMTAYIDGHVVPEKGKRSSLLDFAMILEAEKRGATKDEMRNTLYDESPIGYTRKMIESLGKYTLPAEKAGGEYRDEWGKQALLLYLDNGVPVFPGIRVITEASALLRQMQAVSSQAARAIASYVTKRSNTDWEQGWPYAAAFQVLGRMAGRDMGPEQILALLDLCLWPTTGSDAAYAERLPGVKLLRILEYVETEKLRAQPDDLVHDVCERFSWPAPDSEPFVEDYLMESYWRQDESEGEPRGTVLDAVFKIVATHVGQLCALRRRIGSRYFVELDNWRQVCGRLMKGKLVICQRQSGPELGCLMYGPQEAGNVTVPEEHTVWTHYWFIREVLPQLAYDERVVCPAAGLGYCEVKDDVPCELFAVLRKQKECHLGELGRMLTLDSLLEY